MNKNIEHGFGTILILLAMVINTDHLNSTLLPKMYLSMFKKIESGFTVRELDVYEWNLEVVRYNLTTIHTLEEIYTHLQLLSATPFGHIRLQNLTMRNGRARLTALTSGGNHIPYINITVGSYVQKPAIVIVAGIHGCDWLAVAAAMNLIQELVVHYDKNSQYAKPVTWIIVPVLNPDGYNATLSNDNMRNWLKNMFKPPDDNETNCFGVDLSRNFEYQWMDDNYATATWCDKHYSDKPFSQNESKALRDTLWDHLGSVKIYVALKQFERTLMYPYRYSLIKPTLWKYYEYTLRNAANAAYKQHRRFFDYGHVLKFQNHSAGESDDWIKAHMGVQFSFTFEVSNFTDNSKMPSSTEIQFTNDETFAALKVIAMIAVKLDEEIAFTIIGIKNRADSLRALPNKISLQNAFVVLIIWCSISSFALIYVHLL